MLADFRSEVDILSKVRHVNCVLFLGASSHPPELMIVTGLWSTTLSLRMLTERFSCLGGGIRTLTSYC